MWVCDAQRSDVVIPFDRGAEVGASTTGGLQRGACRRRLAHRENRGWQLQKEHEKDDYVVRCVRAA
jgi:hypothetical protein